MLCLWISRLSAGHGSLGRRSGRPWGAQAMAEAESGAFAPLRGASHLLCSCKETWPEGGAFQQPNGWSTRLCLSAFRTSGTPGPLRRRDFSTRPSCDAAGAGAVASRRQPAHRGEAVLRLFPPNPCTSPLRGLVRRLRRCGRGPESQMQRKKRSRQRQQQQQQQQQQQRQRQRQRQRSGCRAQTGRAACAALPVASCDLSDQA